MEKLSFLCIKVRINGITGHIFTICHRHLMTSTHSKAVIRGLCTLPVVVVCGLFKTQCQQELDQILERISKMPFRDNRGPLEDLYALHIPNCDKRGQYNLKQVTPGILGKLVVGT